MKFTLIASLFLTASLSAQPSASAILASPLAVRFMLQIDPPGEGAAIIETEPIVKSLDAFSKGHGLVRAVSGGDEWVVAIRASTHQGLDGYEVADGILRLSRVEGGKILPGSVKDAPAVAFSKTTSNLSDAFGKAVAMSAWGLLSRAKVLPANPDWSEGSTETAPQTSGDRDLRVLYRPLQPPFPPEAKFLRTQGRVLVDVRVGTDGIPISATVVEGPTPFHAYARNWALKWKFHPAEHDGHPVDSHYTLTMHFKLN